MSDQEKSAFQASFEQIERYRRSFDVAGFFGVGGESLPSIAIQVPTKDEEMRAIVMAFQQAHELTRAAGTAADEAKRDGDLIEELKTINVLFFACRDADKPERHAFQHPEWMRKNLDSDHIGTLLRLLEECRKHRGPLPWDIDAARVEDTRALCVAAWDTDVPERVLANMDREYLTAMLITAMKQWHDERERYEPAER